MSAAHTRASLEQLEERRVMAFDLVSAYAAADAPFYVAGQVAQPKLNEAPQQVTLRFSPGVKIDAATLGGITVVASGGDGTFGNGNDATLVPGSVTVDDLPNQNQVVIRFSETLPDDTYRIMIGGGSGGLKTTSGDTMAADRGFDVRLDVGAFVVAVVPQPVSRTSGALTQDRNSIVVHFNRNDPLSKASAETAGLYRLFEVNAAGDDVPATLPGVANWTEPTKVIYDAAAGTATLMFAAGGIADDKLYRLQIGGASAVVGGAVAVAEGSDENSSFTTAHDMGTLAAAGALITGAIVPRPTTPTPVGSLSLTTPDGAIDSPGHREIPADSGGHGNPYVDVSGDAASNVILYNFRSDYGSFNGVPQQNAITETQKQRAREVFELFGRTTGMRFVETDSQGMTIATGDIRVAAPSYPPQAVAGIGGGAGVIINSSLDWGQSEYGGGWFMVALHEIGHALGLAHSYDLPTVMGKGLPGEAVFPSDYDIEQLAQYYPANANDIDLYKFKLDAAGKFTAETMIARPGQPLYASSTLDSLLTLYREDIVGGKAVRTLVARNDDSFGRDSFLGLDLAAGTYFIAVSSTGNDAFNAEVSDSGANGRTDGAYQLKLGFQPASLAANTIVDSTGTPLDGDRDGKSGGIFNFWFTSASTANTIFVDKAAAAGGSGPLGSVTNPHTTISAALAAVGAATRIVRIVGNDQNKPYLVGTALDGRPLADGATFNVPKSVTAMIDAGAIIKLRATNIDVGSSSPLVSRACAALQVLGTPDKNVIVTSYHDDAVGGDSDGVGPAVTGGQWGGIVLRSDSDTASKKAFVNSIAQATITYGGGQVLVDSQLDSFAPITLESARPTIVYNTILKSAGAGIAANPDSFEESNGRVGPELRGNRLLSNSINGLFVKIRTALGGEPERLGVPARLKSTDIVYVLQDNLLIGGGAGGYARVGGVETARKSGRLAVDPGVVVKLQGARIELERGSAQLIAEGTAGQRVIFTSLGDNRFGAGGTFDTNGNLPDVRNPGDWGGIVVNANAKASIDYAYVAYGGGQTPIEGSFDTFNVFEVHQGDMRLAHSRVEANAAGTATGTRSGRGTNVASTVFVRGAQPVIIGNDFRDNLGTLVSINANSLNDLEVPDPGRSTGAIDRDARYDANRGPLVRDNRISYTIDTTAGRPAGAAIGGMEVRGEELDVESVWDDVGIAHVLRSEIIVQNFHTYTGIRLLSDTNASLVIKLLGANAGFTAAGYGLDIEDRIGGTVQVVGQPGYPVVLTSLADDTVGASLDALGLTVKDTNSDGTASTPTAGDWRSLQFLPMSNDRNVEIVQESEKPATQAIDVNSSPGTAQGLGVLAPNFATGSNTFDSAQEKSGDDIRRLGFEVHGNVAIDDPTDVDVYSFTGYVGSEVWIDIDKTSPSLDTMIELLDAAGNVRARSIDSQLEGGIGRESVAGQATTNPVVFTFPLGHTGIRTASLLGLTVGQSFTVDAAGVFTFSDIGGYLDSRVVAGSFDPTTGIVTLTYNTAPSFVPQIYCEYTYAAATFAAATTGTALPLARESVKAGDHYSTNPKDAGMRVVLPGDGQPAGTAVQYFVRVRSQPRYEPVATGPANGGVAATTKSQYEADLADPAKVKSGVTSGSYELRVRLRQLDDKPGSTVRYADIRYPTVGIDVKGLPRNSLLTSETGENPTDTTSDATSNPLVSAQYVGNLLQADRNTIGIAGDLSSASDVDWYSFALNYEQIQSIGGVNGGQKTWSTVFDLDYGDGVRGDLTISVFDSQGRLLYVGRDSNVKSDQPGAGQGADADDLSRGSLGTRDAFIGSVQMPAGNPTGSADSESGLPATPPDPTKQLRFYVAVSSNNRLPTALNASFNSAALNSAIRLEPVNSVTRVVEDHIGSTGYASFGASIAPSTKESLFDLTKLSTHVTPFSLSDVTLFVSSGTRLLTVDAMRGGIETIIRDYGTTAADDLLMRADGKLYSYRGLPLTANTAGVLAALDAGTGGVSVVGNDSIPDTNAAGAVTTDNVDALAWNWTLGNNPGSLYYSVREGGQSRLYRADPNTGSAAMVTGQSWGYKGLIQDAGGKLGRVTGMAFVGGTLFGVDTNGYFFTINVGSGTATLIDLDRTTPLVADPLKDALGNPARFAGLAIGPQNLYDGELKNVLFAIDTSGTLRALDATGVLQKLFDADADGVADATSIDTGAGGVTGLAFSPLDVNLWHPTLRRRGDQGHGVNAPLDNTREAVEGGTSMYFGFEQYVNSNAPYLNTAWGATVGQYGVASSNWQQTLSSNSAFPNTYNLPGGAYGSLTTNAFSLAGRSYAEKPTLYFNYFLQSDPNSAAAYDQDTMRDSARVFISADGGITWEVVATNNPTQSATDTADGELPATISTSSDASFLPNQAVQPLFRTANWRQARVDLGNWAGKSDLRLRIDFSTAGEMDPDQVRAATTTVAADVTGSTTVSLASVAGILPGMTVVATGVGPAVTVVGVDTDAGAVELSAAVTLRADDTIGFSGAAAGFTLNNIAGYANTTGSFRNSERGTRNDYEGFYVDDFVVGFAERGEMVTGAAAGQTGFFATPSAAASQFVPAQNLQGKYQIEIRRGSEYGALASPTKSDVAIYQTFDTNANLVPAAGFFRGDSNQPREQGQFLIANNIVSNARTYGISIDAARDGSTNAPVPGAVQNRTVLNAARLVPGVVVANNVIAAGGIGGILFSGDPNTGNVPLAAVPFGRFLNNTVSGGVVLDLTAATTSGSTTVTLASTTTVRSGMLVSGAGIQAGATVVQVLDGTRVRLSASATATAAAATLTFRDAGTAGTGIQVMENAGPTLLNNLFANLATGIRVDVSSVANTVIGTSAYWNTTAAVSGATQSQQLTLTADPFVSAVTGNYYLRAGSLAIDSGLNSLADRPVSVAVKSPLGIPDSPIIVPERDLFGQLRADDPSQASQPGLGSNVFKDRGAVDRVDFTQPSATLVKPLDQGADDRDTVNANVVVLRSGARGQTSFELQLNDIGVGIDKSTVTAAAFTLTRDGAPLTLGTDYVFRYLETSNRVVFEAASVFPLGTYVITATSIASAVGVPGQLADLANNTLLPNKTDGSTSFSIVLAEVPDAPTAVVTKTLDGAVRLSWTTGAENGATISDHEIEYSTTGTFPGKSVSTTSAAATFTVPALANGTAYFFRVRSLNAVGGGVWSAVVGPVMPLPKPSFALLTDTGDSVADGISQVGDVGVTGLQPTPGVVWQYSVDGGANWQAGTAAAFTLAAGSYATNAVQVRQLFPAANTDTSDVATNAQPITIDVARPTIQITSSKPTLRTGDTATISFVLSEASTTFGLDDVSVVDGTLSNFQGSGAFYSVTFAPSAAPNASGMIAVAANSFADVAGNLNVAGALTTPITIDNLAPTIAITSSQTILKIGATTTLTFTLDENSSDFGENDVVVTGGVLSAFTGSGALYSATFTPSTGYTGQGTVSVAASTFTDLAGNPNVGGILTPSLSIDTQPPTIGIASDAASLRIGQTARITFALSENAGDFAATDVVVTGGVLSNFSGSGASYSATFIPTPGFVGEGTIAVAAATFSDAFGNANLAGVLATPIAIDTVAPSISITSSKTSLRIGETAAITFTLSESSATFGVDDVAVGGGTLSGFSGSGTTYSATFTPNSGFAGPGTVAVAAAAFTDAAGNGNVSGSLATPISIDTLSPTVTITSNRSAIKIGETATITFTLSESSADFISSDVAVSGGTLSGFAGSGISYSAIFTPTPGFSGAGTVSVAAAAFTDAIGNANTAAVLDPVLTIDTIAPGLSIAASNAALKIGETATITFSLTEPSVSFGADDVAVVGGVLSGFSGSGTIYSATFIPTPGFTGTGGASVAAGTFTDLAGNANIGASLGTPIAIDTLAPTMLVASDRATLRAGETAVVTFTLSEPSTTFVASDIVVVGGTISGFQGSATSYSARFVPQTGFVGTGTVSVGNFSFTDLAGNIPQGPVPAVAYAIDTLPPAAPLLVLDDDIADGATFGEASRPAGVASVTGESGATINVTFVGGARAVTKTITGSGAAQRVVLSAADVGLLGDGRVNVTATQTDAAGNSQVDAVAAVGFLLDTIVPVRPVLTLGAGVANGATLAEASAGTGVVSVAGEPGASLVIVFAGASATVTKTATGTGGTLPIVLMADEVAQLGNGAVTVTCTQQDTVGNVSPAGTIGFAIDMVAPTLVAFSALVGNGTYRTGATIPLVATFSESVPAGTAILVRLNTGSNVVVPLRAASAGTELRGTYVVANGQAVAKLNVSSYAALGSVTDLAGNQLAGTPLPGGTGQIAARQSIAVDGVIKVAAAAGFSTNPANIANLNRTVVAVPITFSAPVRGLTASSFRLLLNGRSISLRGSVLTGGGANYTLRLPARLASAKGIYTLQIDPAGIRAADNAAPMTQVAQVFWGNGRSVTPAVTAKALAFAGR